MKKIIILLFMTLHLYGASFWTLSGLEAVNVHVLNSMDSLAPATIEKIKQEVQKVLHAEGIKTGQQDSPSLVVRLQEIVAEDKMHYVYTRLEIGEEVKTSRKGASEVFANTYSTNDFFETSDEELSADVLDSIDFLLSKFKGQYEDDKE